MLIYTCCLTTATRGFRNNVRFVHSRHGGNFWSSNIYASWIKINYNTTSVHEVVLSWYKWGLWTEKLWKLYRNGWTLKILIFVIMLRVVVMHLEQALHKMWGSLTSEFKSSWRQVISFDTKFPFGIQYQSLWSVEIGSRLWRNRLWVLNRVQSQIYIISYVHRAHDYSGPFGSSGYIWLDTKIVLQNKMLLLLQSYGYYHQQYTAFTAKRWYVCPNIIL